MILDNSNVVSSIEEACQTETEVIWKTLYPEEPYILDLTMALSEDISGKASLLEKCTKYDLVSGVKRQNPFFYQVTMTISISILLNAMVKWFHIFSFSINWSFSFLWIMFHVLEFYGVEQQNESPT